MKSELTDMETINSYFTTIAKAYNSRPNQAFYADLARRLCRAILQNNLKPKNILEIGCGSGFATQEIAGHFPDSTIIAIDPVAPLLAMAKSQIESPRVEFKNHSFSELEEDNQADLIIANMSYHWLSQGERLKLAARIKMGTPVALSVPLRTNHTTAFLSRSYSGNRMIFKAFKALAASGDIDKKYKSWRGLELEPTKKMIIKANFVEEYKVVESLAASEFLKTVISRGLLLAIFGDKADAARVWMSQHLPSGGDCLKLAWPLAFCLATTHSSL